MAKMETASILLALGGDSNNTVPKYAVTPAEVAVLRVLHGEQSVTDIDVNGFAERTDRQEIARLQQTYNRRDGANLTAREVNTLYPGAAARVELKFADLELPDALYAVKERKIARDTDDGETTENGDKPLDKMTKTELEVYASKYPDLELAGVTKKDDIRAAIELHEEKLAAAEQNGEKKTDSVFE